MYIYIYKIKMLIYIYICIDTHIYIWRGCSTEASARAGGVGVERLLERAHFFPPVCVSKCRLP